MASLNSVKRTKRLFLTFLKHRYFCTKNSSNDVKKLRNIGILAHIDAGKTTTTERMLFFSGKLNSMGEVHHGNTVTDYLEQERERGITITSAAVTFPWKNHTINLIDTPGHIDFTMEVEQTLNVLDGAVVVLDASAGVEAQTITVWKQADRYKIPRIVFVNKTDRIDADIFMCCYAIESKLDVPSLLIHLPVKENEKFIGIVDVLSLEKITWGPSKESKTGKILIRTKLTQEDDILWAKAQKARGVLIDKLSDIDDNLAEIIIKTESTENISEETLIRSLKKATISQKGVPVLCGSSYKNIGVQTLMDSIILYLPSPEERNKQFKCFENNLCAKAFKVIHDRQRGPLVFFRIYSGHFIKSQKIYNVHQDLSEQTGKLLVAYADEFQEVSEITNGNIAVLTGLKKTIIGDMVTSNQSALTAAKKNLVKITKNEGMLSDKNVDKLFGLSRTIPEPVFFCSVEPPSLMYQTPLENALKELEREDPSLRVEFNQETGQTVLAGMGELHIEIIKDKLMKKYKIDVLLGPLQIAYKEAPFTEIRKQKIYETKIGNSKQYVNITLSVIPNISETKKDILSLDKSPESASNLAKLHPKHLLAVKQGVEVALNHGPKLGCPIVNTNIMLHYLEVGRGTSESIISATVTQCIRQLLDESGTMILEPIMNLEVVLNDEDVSAVLADLSRRRAEIEQVGLRGKLKVINCTVPLSEMMDYSKILRTITSGTGTFSLEFNCYRQMSPDVENSAIKRVTGF